MLERYGDEYANTAGTDLFLDRNKPSYIGGMPEMANERLYPFWGSLTEALRTGHPQNEARVGENFFTALYQDPDRLRQFLHSMTGLSMGAAMAIAEKIPGSLSHRHRYRSRRRMRASPDRLAPSAPDRRRLRPATRTGRL